MNSIPELLALTYRDDLGLLIARWGYQPDPALLPAQYERLTASALAHDVRHWLQDIRRRTLNDPATSRWLLTDYFPNLASRLSGQLRVAYLVSPTLHAHILAEPGYTALDTYVGQPFAVGFFGDEGAAVAWLQEG